MRIRRLVFAILVASTSAAPFVHAADNVNIIRTPAAVRLSVNDDQFWRLIDAHVTDWENLAGEYDCSQWTPDPATQTIGAVFIQAQACNQDQQRFVQQRERNEHTESIRNAGSAQREDRTIISNHNREAIGALETWVATTAVYTAWSNSGAITGCSNWSPEPATVTVGTAFTQTATNCSQAQTRSRQDREQETTTKAVRNKGVAVVEKQSIAASSTRSSTGVLETWIATTPAYTAWVNSGAVTGCSNWSPEAATVTVGTAFTQTATNCSQTQTRSRQDREQETTTKAVRDKGVVVVEAQSIDASSTRNSTGTKETWVATTPAYTAWVNSGAVTGCSNWSPSPTTITIGTSFTQTATNCGQSQTRSRQDREQEATTKAVRDKGVAVVETQSIVASSTRSSTGTKETWVATTPVYSAWVNSGAVSGCSNWSPDPATITIGSSFTQTATNCSQSQTRSRQDREQETTTKAVRDKGVSVVETQSIVASSTRSSTGTKETWVATTPVYTAWVNSGAVSGCSNWSPDPATVASGTGFTQTATNCSQAQVRSRQDREQETTTKAIRNKGAAVTETTSIVASSTRSAVGTKAVQQCLYNLSTYNFKYTYIQVGQGGMGVVQTYRVIWGGAIVSSGNGWPTSVVAGGYIYTRGAPLSSGSLEATVCRQ